MKIIIITVIFSCGYLSPFSQSILGESINGTAVKGSSTSSVGVYGISTSSVGVYGSSSSSFGVFGSSSSHIGVYGSSSSSYGVRGYSYSSVGVVAYGSTYDFDATGPGVNYGSTSSIRWKRNVVNIPSPLEKLNKLRGVYFDWDEDHGGQHDVGFIAEEVGQVIPEIVVYEENGVDASGMDYSKMTPLLVEAANAMRKEYQEKFDLQQKEINTLKQNQVEIESLKKEISQLKELVSTLTTLKAD